MFIIINFEVIIGYIYFHIFSLADLGVAFIYDLTKKILLQKTNLLINRIFLVKKRIRALVNKNCQLSVQSSSLIYDVNFTNILFTIIRATCNELRNSW